MSSKAKIAVLKARYQEALNSLSTADGIFVLGILSKKNGADAYADSRGRAILPGDAVLSSRRLKRAKIKKVFDLQKQIKLAEYQITPNRILGVFARIAFSKKKTTKDSDRLRAARELGKISGLYVIDEEESEARLRRLIREALTQFVTPGGNAESAENQIANSLTVGRVEGSGPSETS
jgi:hypothetical protein